MGLLTATKTCTIAAGDTGLSAAVFLGEKALCGVLMPATWVAADLTFQWSFDGVAWAELIDAAGNAVTVASPTQATQLALDPSDFSGVVWLKVRSGTAALAVNQTATRVLTLLTRRFYPTR